VERREDEMEEESAAVEENEELKVLSSE